MLLLRRKPTFALNLIERPLDKKHPQKSEGFDADIAIRIEPSRGGYPGCASQVSHETIVSEIATDESSLSRG